MKKKKRFEEEKKNDILPYIKQAKKKKQKNIVVLTNPLDKFNNKTYHTSTLNLLHRLIAFSIP